ncbi:cytomegalovirus gH-receptor family protein [Aspergillus sp. HF37]|nr:cytomegalovirus gH-receptor family protein [Aspergillus sp. HF37]
MLLLMLARSRYRVMKVRESEQQHAATTNGAVDHHQNAEKPRGREAYSVDGSRRVGGWGVVEVSDDKRRWIYADDPEGLRRLRGKEEKEKSAGAGGKGEEMSLDHVQRYEMVAKRIW